MTIIIPKDTHKHNRSHSARQHINNSACDTTNRLATHPLSISDTRKHISTVMSGIFLEVSNGLFCQSADNAGVVPTMILADFRRDA